MILVRWRLGGEDWQQREYQDDMLQTLMDRANAVFGNPDRDIGGPSESTESEGSAYDRAQKQQRLGALQPKKSRVDQGKPKRNIKPD